MSKKTMKMVGIFMLVAGIGLISWFVIDKAFPGIFPDLGGGDGGGGNTDPRVRMECITTFKNGFPFLGMKYHSVSCSTTRMCELWELGPLDHSTQSDNGESGYIDYQMLDRSSVRQKISLGGLYLPDATKSYLTEFCTTSGSGSAKIVRTDQGSVEVKDWSV